MFFVYVLKNSETNKIYIGQTCDLEKRIQRHNDLVENKKTSYTHKNMSSGEWLLVYKEEFVDRKLAKVREKELKSYRGREFVRKIIE